MKILTRLEVITLKENFVLIDGSVSRLRIHRDIDLFDSLYTAGSYRRLPVDLIKKEIASWRSFYYCITRDNVWTVPEMYEEIKNCSQILLDKYDFLENNF